MKKQKKYYWNLTEYLLDGLGTLIICLGICWFMGMFFIPPMTYALFMDTTLRDGWFWNQWTFLIMSIILWTPILYFIFKPETREQRIKRLTETLDRLKPYRFSVLELSDKYYETKKELDEMLSSDKSGIVSEE